MSLLDAVFHLFNFAAPALVLALLGSAAAKILWRNELRSVSGASLVGVSTLASFATEVAGLVITGRDATMAVYAAMALTCAASLWWSMRRR
jgi:hypothetical protein